MVDAKSFTEGFDLITKNFGSNSMPFGKMARVRQICENRISGSGFLQICQNLCDRLRVAPLPKDFEEEVQLWRKNFYYTHGHGFGQTFGSKTISPDGPSCSYCLDLGVVMITRHTEDGWHTLMRCDCGNRSEMNLQIPEWDNGLKGAFKKDSCPISWFKPEIVPGEGDKTISTKIWNKVKFFKEQKQNAEQYWMSLGFKQ